MNFKKVLATTMAVTLAVSMFAGCGDKKTSTSSPSNSSVAETSKDPVTLKVSVWDNSSNKAIDNLVTAFEASQKDVKIELIDIPSAEYTNKLSVMLNGGSDVDAFFVKDSDTTRTLYNKGQLLDLTSKIKDAGINMDDYNGLAKNFTFDGKTVGLPYRTDYYVMYYNKDLFDAAKMEYPTNDTTWAQFEEMAKKLTSGEGATKNYGALLHTWNACVQNWGVQDGKNTIMSKDYSFFKPYYEMALRMQNTDKSIMDYATMKTANIHYSSPFLTGNVAMMPMGTWFMSTIIAKKEAGESKVNWGVATIPHAEGVAAGTTVGSATPFAINPKSKNTDAAWEFLQFVTSAEGADVIAKTGTLPSRLNEATLKSATSAKGMPEGVVEALTVKQISLDRPIEEKVVEINKMLGEEHGLIMLGESTVDEGLANMAKRNKEILG